MHTVAFCRPGSSFSSQWVGCWTDMMFHCAKNGIAVIDRPGVHHNIHSVRDLCLDIDKGRINEKPFKGELDYTHLMWIDSDQIWTPEQFQRLLDADKDIVCGWYVLTGTEDVICAGWYDEEVFEDKGGLPLMKRRELRDAPRDENGLIDLGDVHPEYDYPWTGFGFTLIKKGVFEKIPYPWFFDNLHIVGNHISNMGDDISFFKKAKEAGFKVYLAPDIKVGHQKSVIF